MDFDFLTNLGWRAGLFAVIGILMLYVARVFLRMRRLRKEAVQAKSETSVLSFTLAAEAYRSEQSSSLEAEAAPSLNDPHSRAPFSADLPIRDDAQERRMLIFENELSQLRQEIGLLRAEVALLGENVGHKHEQPPEMSKPPKISPSIAPQYGDAMQLAMHGDDATAIAQQCGITRAEAELVAALARSGNRTTDAD